MLSNVEYSPANTRIYQWSADQDESESVNFRTPAPTTVQRAYLLQTIDTLFPDQLDLTELLPNVVQCCLQQWLVVFHASEGCSLDIERFEQIAKRFRFLVEPDVELQQVDAHNHIILQLGPLLSDDVGFLLDVVALTVLQILQAGGQLDEKVVYCVSFDLWV